MSRTNAARKKTWWIIGLVGFVIGIAFGLAAWIADLSAFGTRIWQARLIGFIWLLCMMAVFEGVSTTGKAGRRITWALLGIGLLMHAIRIWTVIGSSWLPETGADIRLVGGAFNFSFLVSKLSWFLAVALFSLTRKNNGGALAARLARISMPVIGTLLFLSIYRGLHMCVSWSNTAARYYQSTWPVALGIPQILLPMLFLASYVLLIANPVRARVSATEWLSAGVVIGLAFTIPQYSMANGIWEWLGDAGTAMAAIGFMALLTSLVHRNNVTGIAQS